jgi:predicted dehydrogenase
MEKIRWGILSTAKIGREKVIPAMQKGAYCEVAAIASSNVSRLKEVADSLHIPKTYDSYERLLADPEIDAVYIPLPNHLHVEWSIKALKAGKHVLCEKPVGLSSAEALQLLEVAKAYPHLKVMEAFMYRFHPQWKTTKQLIDDGRIGELRTIQSFFSYHNIDPANIRNRTETGGGAMMDIGCYCVSFARYLFEQEPLNIFSVIDTDPSMGIDRMASVILQFARGTSTFACSTQLFPFQRVNIIGTAGRIEIEIPVNAPPDKVTRINLYSSPGNEEILFEPVDQYTIQADEFSKAALNIGAPLPSLEDAIQNMKVLEVILAKKGGSVLP